VAEWLEHSALVLKALGSKFVCTGFSKSLCSPNNKMGTWLSSEAGKVKGGEEEERVPHLSYSITRNKFTL